MAFNDVTLVTCFFDIHRESKGDGRTIDEYKDWIKKTLQLNCNLFIVTELKFYDFFVENRPKQYNTHIKIIEFSDLHYNKYYDQIKTILGSDYYKNKIAYPNRVECKLPEYNIIQYSKFHCLQMAIDENKFNSNYFFWIDAGISRFFLDVNLSIPYPSNNCIQFLKQNENKFLIQNRSDLKNYVIDEKFIWGADNLLIGTMFGGNINVIQEIAKLVENTFVTMLNGNNANNEQLALALVWNSKPQLFYLFNNIKNYHLIIFKILSL